MILIWNGYDFTLLEITRKPYLSSVTFTMDLTLLMPDLAYQFSYYSDKNISEKIDFDSSS